PRNIDGELTTLQFIPANCGKNFLKFGAKTGSFFAIGTPNNTLQIGEGLATCATLHAATGIATICAFDAGNLEPVARVHKAKYPNEDFVIGADDDWKGDG